MANQAFKREELSLWDDTEVVVQTVPIATLRTISECWEKGYNALEEGADGLDVWIEACGIALYAKNFKDKYPSPNADEKKAGKYISQEFKDYLTENLDRETIFKILDVAADIKLNDPKFLEAAAAAAALAEDGQN